MVPRKYKVKDVDMVLAISTIVENAKLNQPFLQTTFHVYDGIFQPTQTEIGCCQLNIPALLEIF